MIQTIIGIVVAFFIALYFYRKSASKKDVEKIKIEVEKTRKEFRSFIDGFAENIPSDEPLKKKMEEADSLFHENRFKEAYDLYDEINKKALSEGKEKIFALSLMGKGISIGKQKEFPRATEILKIVEDYKDFLNKNAKSKLYFNLGFCNAMLKNNDLAITYFSKSLNEFHNVAHAHFATVYYNRGVSYGEKGELNRAIQDYDKAIDLNPKDLDAYINRGVTYGEKEKYEHAIQDFNKVIELNPSLTEAFYNRGIAYVKQRDYDRGIQDFDKAVEMNPEYAKAYTNRGFAYREKGEYKRAIRDFNKAIKLDPKKAAAYFDKAIACELIEKNKEAIKSYKIFLELSSKKDKKEIAHAEERIEKLQKKIERK